MKYVKLPILLQRESKSYR